MKPRAQANTGAMGHRARKPLAIDLFAGVGGLSLGLQRAGFRVRVAVEIDEDAVRTYRANHPGTKLIADDIQTVTGPDILSKARTKKVDLLVGCAPCQGFCSLTRKFHRRDPRNDLLLEMARLIRSIRPRAVFMENVPGLATVGKGVYRNFLRALRSAGYKYEWRMIQMADYGLPQFRRRLVLLAGRGFPIPFPSPTHARVPRKGTKVKKWVSVKVAIGGRRAPTRLGDLAEGGPQTMNWHVVRSLKSQTLARLRAARPGQARFELDEALLPECHQDGYEGFRNVYGRMSWDKPSPTITGGCTTPAKGRFGHPDRRRTTISVREAALLQSFPASYKFSTDRIDAACEMIGNAVPPAFAEVLGVQLKRALAAASE